MTASPWTTAADRRTRTRTRAAGYVRAFHETDTSQAGHVTQSWDASHLQYADGRNNGFIGPESSSDWSMAYYTGEEIPFYHSLAKTFPLCDRYFCSVLAQTYPNRRFLLSGTAFGLIATDTSSITGIPPNGTIFDRLDAHDISWASYATNVSTLYVISDIVKKNPSRIKTIDQFHADAKSGSLPSVSYVDPNILTGTEENPQDISLGEYFVSTVASSLLNSPAWDKHHARVDLRRARGLLRPRAAAAGHPARRHPTGALSATDQPGAYDRYGFRVPTVVMSPYSKRNYVSHTVYDHTSVLKTIERKWNLPAMTYRDANANDLLDCLDLRTRAFREPPTLAAPGNPTGVSTAPVAALRQGATLRRLREAPPARPSDLPSSGQVGGRPPRIGMGQCTSCRPSITPIWGSRRISQTPKPTFSSASWAIGDSNHPKAAADFGARWFEADDGTQVHLSLDPAPRTGGDGAHRHRGGRRIARRLQTRLTDAGVRFKIAEFDGNRIILCKDPAGNRWELRS